MDIVQDRDSFKAHQDNAVNPTVDSMLAAIAKLPIPPTAKYVGTIMVTMRLIDSKALAEFTGIPLRSVQRAMMQVGASGVIGAINVTSGAPAASLAPPVAQIEDSEPRTHARIELPSEVLTLEVKKDTPPPPKGPGKAECLQAFELYNETALRCAIPQAAKFTPDRQRKIAARLKVYGMEGWKRALANIEKSSFLTGGTSHNFRADLDFVLQDKSFGRLHDGGYGNGRHAKAPVAIRMAKTESQIAAENEAMLREYGLHPECNA